MEQKAVDTNFPMRFRRSRKQETLGHSRMERPPCKNLNISLLTLMCNFIIVDMMCPSPFRSPNSDDYITFYAHQELFVSDCEQDWLTKISLRDSFIF